MSVLPETIIGNPAQAGFRYIGPVLRHGTGQLRQEVEPGQYVIHDRDTLGEVPNAVFNPAYRAQGSEDMFSRWMNSWSITYGPDGAVMVEPAALMLIQPEAVYPNKFDGPVVAETWRRFIQSCGYELFVAHPRHFVGALALGRFYRVQYHGMNCTHPTVRTLATPASRGADIVTMAANEQQATRRICGTSANF